MRILQLALNPYGCFGNLLVNFAEDRNFYALYGPNEAGKSTVLRAFVNLLYGIPKDTRDVHTYDAPTLRIGALIKASSGKQLEFLRRKGNRDTILDKSNNLPLADNVLGEYLSEATRELFTNMFAISHEKLLEGGKLLLSLEGDAGASIFAAGAGLLELRNVLKRLDEKAEQLFKPGGKIPFINSKINEFTKAKADIARYAVLPARWQQLERQLDDKIAEQDTLQRNLLNLQEKKAQLERVKRVLPQLAVITEFESELDKLGKFVMLPERAKNERLVASKQKMMASDNIKKANDDIEELEKQIENLRSPEELLAQADTIIEIHKNIGKYRSARKDLPELYAKVEALETDAANYLRKIDPGLALDKAGQLVIPEDKAELIKILVKDRATIQSVMENIKVNIASAELDQKAIADDIDKIGILVDPTKLVIEIEATKKQGDPGSTLDTARANIKTLKEDTLLQLKKLGLEVARIEEAEELHFPLVETIEHYAEIFIDYGADSKVVNQARETSREKERTANAELEKLQLYIGDIPTVDDLRDARRNRQEIWGTVRLQLGVAGGTAREGLAIVSNQSLEQYEISVDEADKVADRLYQNEEHVTRKAQLISDRHEVEIKLDDLKEKIESLDSRFATHELEWISIWKPIGIPPKTPAEMRGWLAEYRKQEDNMRKIREEENNAKSLESMILRSRKILNSLIEEIGELPGSEEESMSSLLDRAVCITENIKEAVTTQAARSQINIRCIPAQRGCPAGHPE